MHSSNFGSDWGELLRELPDSEVEVLRRIDALVDAAEFQSALDRIDEALAHHATPRLRIAHARLALEQRKYDRAKTVLEPITDPRTSHPVALLLLAEAHLECEEFGDARSILELAEDAGASEQRLETIWRRLDSLDDASRSKSDGGHYEAPLDSTVDARLEDLIEASAMAAQSKDRTGVIPVPQGDGDNSDSSVELPEPGDSTVEEINRQTAEIYDDPEDGLSPDLHSETFRAPEQGEDGDENPFENMGDTVFDETTNPESSGLHDESSLDPEDFGEVAETVESPAPDEADASSSSEIATGPETTEERNIGRRLEGADPEFYSDVEDTTFEVSVNPSDMEGGEEPAPTVENDISDLTGEDEVFRITTSTSGSGLQLEDMLVEGRLEGPETDGSQEVPETDIDELETSPVYEYADERDDFQFADPEPTHLINLDDAPTEEHDDSGGESRADSPPTIEVDESLRDSPTTPDLPGLQENPNSKLRIGGGGDDAPTDPEVPQLKASGELKRREEAPTDPWGGSDDGGQQQQQPNQRQPARSSREAQARARGPEESQRTNVSKDSTDQHADKNAPQTRQDRPKHKQPDNGVRQRQPANNEPDRQQQHRSQERARRHPLRESRQRSSDRRRARADQNQTISPDGMQSGISRVSAPEERESEDNSQYLGVVGGLTLPDWLTSKGAFLVGAVTVASVTVALLFIGAVTTTVDARRLAGALNQADRVRSSDTYQGWTEAFRTTHSVAKNEPGFIRTSLHSLGEILPFASPTKIRRRIRRRRAFLASVIEYRFETFGTRRSAELAERDFTDDEAPLASAARVYRLLAQGQTVEALELAREAHHRHKEHRLLTHAYLETLLRAEKPGDLVREIEKLKERTVDLTVHERYIVARAARYQEDISADVLLETLVEKSSPSHLDAKIERIRVLGERESFQEATTLGRRLLDEIGNSASSYQRANLHIALGETYAAMGKRARAEEQFRSAIKEQSERTSVYLPLTDLFIADGRLKKARHEVESAESKAQATPRLMKRKATLKFLRGKFDEALETVKGNAGVDAPVLLGRILLAIGDYKKAREVLNSIGESHPRFASAKTLELLSRIRMDVDDRETVLEELSEVLSESSDDPLVLRTAAQIRLHYARSETGREHQEHLDEALELLEDAVEAQPDRSLNHYLLCECHLLAEDAPSAAEACRKARRQNPDFLPGMLTVSRLRLRRGKTADARAILDELVEKFDSRWDVAKLRIRALLRNNEPDQARNVLDKWLQRPQAKKAEFNLFEGLVAYAQADYPTALGYFEKAQNASDYKDEATLYETHTLVRLGQLDKAEDLVRELVTHPRWRPTAWLIFGELRRRQERYSDALENLRLAQRHFDSDFAPPARISHLYAERALTWRDRRDWEDDNVWENVQEGKKRGDTESPEIQLVLGLYYVDGPEPDYERAATHLEKVVDLQPYRCEAIDALLVAYDEIRDRDGEDEMEALAEKNCGG